MMIVRKATARDNEGLLQLTRQSPMEGRLQLRIDRDPDFFEILKQRGDYDTFVVEQNNQVIGSWSVVRHSVIINKRKVKLNYLRDLKLHPQYQGSLAIFRLFRFVSDYQRSLDSDLHFTIVLKGNDKVISMLDGRAGLSRFIFVGEFILKFCVLFPSKVSFGKHELDDRPDLKSLCNYFNSFYKKYQLGPMVTEDILSGMTNLILKRDDEILAAVCLEDPGLYRKTIVLRYSRVYKVMIRLMQILGRIRVMAPPPLEGDVLKILYAKYLAFSQSKNDLEKLIRYSVSWAFKNQYHFLCLGFHQNDPLLGLAKKKKGLRIKVLGYAASLKNNLDDLEILRYGMLYEDHPLT